MGGFHESAAGNFVPSVFGDFGDVINASGAEGREIVSVFFAFLFNAGKFRVRADCKLCVFADVIITGGAFESACFSAVFKGIGNFSGKGRFAFGIISRKIGFSVEPCGNAFIRNRRLLQGYGFSADFRSDFCAGRTDAGKIHLGVSCGDN